MQIPDPFLKTENWVYLSMASLSIYTIYFYHMSKLKTTKMFWE